MTNWEKAKPGFDVIFDDLSLDEAVTVLDDAMACPYCKIWEFCNKEMGLTGKDDDVIVTDVTCGEVIRKYLSMEAE